MAIELHLILLIYHDSKLLLRGLQYRHNEDDDLFLLWDELNQMVLVLHQLERIQIEVYLCYHCFYHVYGERKDINPLIVEYEGNSWEDYPDPNYNPNKVDDDEKTYTDPRFAGPPNTYTA